ncbi:hypothetical protein ACH5RR_018080 [Cinchona calisaya]|uniref:Uncharacterized protein n=1 Tax=Cinchona calisaya TaxID=153742 RepID=A0ABD2ZKJ6_9GENT
MREASWLSIGPSLRIHLHHPLSCRCYNLDCRDVVELPMSMLHMRNCRCGASAWVDQSSNHNHEVVYGANTMLDVSSSSINPEFLEGGGIGGGVNWSRLAWVCQIEGIQVNGIGRSEYEAGRRSRLRDLGLGEWRSRGEGGWGRRIWAGSNGQSKTLGKGVG